MVWRLGEKNPATRSGLAVLPYSRIVWVAKAFVGGQDGFAVHVLHDDFELVHEEERLAGFLRQRVEPLLHRGDLVGVGRGEVVLLGRILREVVEVNAGGKHRAPDEFPVALPQRRAERLDVVDELRARRGLALGDGVPDVDAVERLALGGGRPGERGERGIEVHGVDQAVHGLGLDVAGPVGESADARRALEERAFAVTIGAVVARDLHLRHVGHDAREHRVLRAAVVAVEKDERVVADPLLVERGDDTADLVVEARDHAGVGAARGVLDVRIAVDVFLRRLVRRVRGVEGEIEIERLVGVLRLDVFDRVVAEELGRVALLADRLVVAIPVEHAMLLVREVIQLADHRAVLVVEAALPGPILLVGVAKMPLADDRRLVAGFLEALRHEPLGGVQAVGGDGGNDGGLQAVAERITPGHQGRARRRAHRLHVELRELRALRGELVEVRRLDVRASVEADILPAEVVGDDVDDVGFLCCLSSQVSACCEQKGN